jgi:hypothetical protein
MFWCAEDRTWAEDDFFGGYSDDEPERLARLGFRYDAPLFPVPDDDTGIERVVLAICGPRCEFPLCACEGSEWHLDAAVAAIAAIRKGPDND